MRSLGVCLKHPRIIPRVSVGPWHPHLYLSYYEDNLAAGQCDTAAHKVQAAGTTVSTSQPLFLNEIAIFTNTKNNMLKNITRSSLFAFLQ